LLRLFGQLTKLLDRHPSGLGSILQLLEGRACALADLVERRRSLVVLDLDLYRLDDFVVNHFAYSCLFRSLQQFCHVLLRVLDVPLRIAQVGKIKRAVDLFVDACQPDERR
jgi:hypothetical protein